MSARIVRLQQQLGQPVAFCIGCVVSTVLLARFHCRYGGGRPGLSDTFTGAMWVADALFAFAQAGARAFHLHWGLGGHPSGSLGQPNTGVQTNFHFNVSQQSCLSSSQSCAAAAVQLHAKR